MKTLTTSHHTAGAKTTGPTTKFYSILATYLKKEYLPTRIILAM